MEADEREAIGAAGATLETDSPPPALPAETGSPLPTTPPPESPHTASHSEYPQRKRAMQAVERCINDAEAAAQMAATAKDGDADTCASALEPGYLLWTIKRVGTLMHSALCNAPYDV